MLPEDKVLIEEFLSTLRLAERSLQCYYDSLRLFADFMEGRGGLPCAGCADVEEFVDGRAPATRNLRLYVLRPFYSWLSVELSAPLNPISRMRGERPLPAWERAPLSLEDAERAALTCGDDRDELVCRLALHLGLKPVEITGIALRDVSLEPQPMVLCGPVGRRGERRIVALDPAAASLARSVLSQRLSEGAGPQDPLVASRSNNNRGGRVTTASVRIVLRGALAAVGTSPKGTSRRKTPGQDAAPRIPLTPAPWGARRLGA